MRRERFNQSNVKARRYLEKLGFNHIYFHAHKRNKDVYSGHDHENYKQTDLFGSWDGFAWFETNLIFFQVKTNGWMTKDDIARAVEFSKEHPIYAIQINVKYHKKAIKRKHWICECRQVLPLGKTLEFKKL